MNRRTFLRGLGGACVAAPFLGSLGGRSVRAEPVSPPKRLIVMFTHYGCITTRFFPQKSHGALTAADLEGTTLEHLAPFASKVLMPRGIRAMNEWTADMTRGQGNDSHTQVVGSYFTCQPVTPNSDDPFSFESATKFMCKPIGPSLDHVIAQQLSPRGEPLLIAMSGRDGPQSAISYSAAETPYAGMLKPADVFASLTGLFTDGTPTTPDSYQAIRGKSILDLVKDDLDTLQRFDMSQADRRKLEAWKALLSDTGRVIGSAQCRSDAAAALGLTQPTIDGLATSPLEGDVLTAKVTATLDGADLRTNLAVLAALCNANPVLVLKYPPNYVFKGLGISSESASLSHRLDNAGMVGNCVPRALESILAIDDFYARKFAHLVGVLDSFEEGDRTLLDDTAAIWFQEMSDGLAHNLNNLPIVQVGSAGGYFRTGWAVNVEDGAANLTTGNSEEWCGDGTNADRVDGIDQATGTDPKRANAPINKYFCNLMNALGVKAGADGFPAKGGDAEVTHFGRYDRTEDFVGGDVNPPKLHDPGEFTALKATV